MAILVETIFSTEAAAKFAWVNLSQGEAGGPHSSAARFGAAARSARVPFISNHDGEDTSSKRDGDNIGANQRPSQRRKTVHKPKRNPEGEHHIHGERQPLCAARANNHHGLR